MARKGGLGRGLSAILPDVEETVAEIERAENYNADLARALREAYEAQQAG